MEAEGHPGEDADFGVHRFDEAVAEPVVEGGVDAFQVADFPAECGEFRGCGSALPTIASDPGRICLPRL